VKFSEIQKVSDIDLDLGSGQGHCSKQKSSSYSPASFVSFAFGYNVLFKHSIMMVFQLT